MFKHQPHKINRPERKLHPLDVSALGVLLGLGVPLLFLLLGGDRTSPQVKAFSWGNQIVHADDTAFILTFNRPMSWASIAEQLRIQPPLPGKASWSGRRFVYTLNQPIPYGQTFELVLKGGTTASLTSADQSKTMEPFTAQFRSRDRAFLYLGVGGIEDGRLILRNLTRNQTTILTPPHLVVTAFKPYPAGDRILFGATQRMSEPQGAFEQKLYTVTTGLAPTPAGQVQPLLDNADYQLLKFELSENGQNVVVQRYRRDKKEAVGLWVMGPDGTVRSLGQQKAGDFLVTPDGSAVAIADHQGVSIVPITPAATQGNPVEYLPQLGVPLGFSRDATAATLMKFNPDGTRSLVLVTSQGVQKEILKTRGYLLETQFGPKNQTVFCLYTQANGASSSTLQISMIEVATGRQTTLKQFPYQTSGHMSLAPDGSALLFDEVKASEVTTTSILRNQLGQAIAQSTVWHLPLNPTMSASRLQFAAQKPVKISQSGIQPHWLP